MTNLVKVTIRVEAMRLAGAWVEEELARIPTLARRFHPDTLKFLRKLSKRSSPRIEVDRGFAERFVAGWRVIFQDVAPVLLLREVDANTRRMPEDAPLPIDGPHAMAEVVLDIQAALTRPRGRQHRVDPVEAFEANESHKRQRQRDLRGAISAHERAAEELGVSKNTLTTAVKPGRETRQEEAQKLAQLPPGAVPLFHLLDYNAPAGDRIKVSVVASKTPPFVGED